MSEKIDKSNHGQLLMTSVRTGKTEIFLVDTQWGELRNLTRTSVGENRYPMWSPDGSRIVFTSDRAAKDTYDLYVMDADGENVRRLTNVDEGGICYFPSWSGSCIYFGYAPPRDGVAVICRINEDGLGLTTIAPGRDPWISPDGKTLAYTQFVNKGYCLFRMNADGTNSKRLTEHENEIGAVAPFCSPDGTRILYSDEVNGKLEIFAFDVARKSAKQLTRLGQFAASAAWSPDMRQISFRVTDYDYWRYPDAKEYVYKEKKGDKRPVWVMNPDKSDAHILELLHYQCSMDGSRAVWKPTP